MNRRQLLTASVLLPILTDVGCAQISQAESDATTIANGVAAILPTVQTLTGISQNVVNSVTKGIAAIKAGATSLASSAVNAASTAGQEVAAGVAAVNAALSNVSVPSWVSTAVSAAETLVPILLQVAGVAAAPAPAPPGSMTVAQARAFLKAVAAN